jgi:hypothetical protein
MANEKTEQEVAAQAASGDNDTGVTDDMLNTAAADAVVTETETDEVIEDLETTEETVVEQEIEEEDEEGLPADHGKRSDLGRKLSAIHRRQDDSDKRLDRLLDALETQTALAKEDEPDPLDGLDLEEPVTVGNITQILDARDKKAKQQTENYDTTYFTSLNKLVDRLEEGERDAVIEELKVLPYDPSANPGQDAENNFSKAERSYLRKQLAGPKDKKNPFTGKQSHGALGTVTNQIVVTKDVTLPKLDDNAASYLAFVESEDGADKAKELHKSIGKA